MIPVVIKGIKKPGTDTKRYYIQAAPTVPITLETIATNISARCTVTETDCLAVLSALETEVISAMMNGNSVRLGQLGSFRPTITSQGVSKPNMASTDLVKSVRTRFTAGSRLRKALNPDLGKVKFLLREATALSDTEETA